jgi:NAD(P)-dependent dehydrogenase (short-subunit alcohol dehydrogenase family)
MQNKKVVIVTGASRGIGRSIALKFVRHHYSVVLVGKDKNELQELSRMIRHEYGGDCLVFAVDLKETLAIKTIVDQVLKEWKRIDVLVNNAAWRTIETMRTISVETWEETIKVCVTAPAFLAKWTAEIMEQSGIPGVIINISSVMSDRAAGYCPAYIASKGAMESLTYELAVTYGRSGIRVLSVRPGYIDTEMSSDYKDENGQNVSEKLAEDLIGTTPLKRAGTGDEVAEAVFWLSTEKASFVTGTSLLIDGGMSHNFNNYSNKNLQFPKEF